MSIKKAKSNSKNHKAKDSRPIASSLDEALKMLQDGSKEKSRKFNESVEAVVMLGIDSKQSNQNVKGSIVLPNGTGKKVKVIVVSPDEASQDIAKKAGAAEVGFEELISKIESGYVDFDSCIATPDAMQKLSKAAKKLGPRGLMPSPKNGTVTNDVVKAVEDSIKGKINFKNEKSGIIHCMFGKVDFSTEKLNENLKALLKSVRDAKPEGVKGKYIKKCYLSTTMGKSVELLEDCFNF